MSKHYARTYSDHALRTTPRECCRKLRTFRQSPASMRAIAHKWFGYRQAGPVLKKVWLR